jgi:uncharacterized membrane protein YfcA
MSAGWLLGAAVVAIACFVQGLAGFGIGLVAMAFLPFLMSPVTAVVLMTLYAAIFTLVIFVPLRRDVTPGPVIELLVAMLVGLPAGVWVLATLPASLLNRLIGALLVGLTVLEVFGLYPRHLGGRGWRLGAGVIAGLLGGAVGTPGPPVVAYAQTQDWSARTQKANLQAFLVVNQAATLVGYWWAGLLTAEVWRLSALFALPAVAGLAVGMLLFGRIPERVFRRVVFAVLCASGVVLLLRG